MSTSTIEPVNISINIGLKDALKDLRTLEQAVVQLEKLRVKSAQNATKATKQQAKEETAVTQQLEKTQITSMGRIISAHDRAEKDKTRATEREAKKQQSAYEKTAHSIMAMMERQAKKEAQIIEQTSRARDRFARDAGRRVVNGFGQSLGIARGMGTAALGIMGGFDISDSVRERANMHGLAAQVAIQGSKSGGKEFNTQDVLGTATAEGIRTGRGTEETIKALGKFTDLTGDLEKGKEVLKTISDYADASGASLSDMAGAAGELFASGTIKNAKELSAALGTYVEMGKSGAVELKDFAKGFAKITSTAGRFGGVSKLENAYTLGSIAEINKAHGGAATPTQALTSIQSFGNDVSNHFSKIQSSLGVQLRDKNGDMRSAKDIIADVTVASKGKAENLDHSFSAQAVRSINGPMETFRDAIKGGATVEQARAAVIKEITDLESKQLTADKALEQATARRAEADRQFASAMEKLKVAVGETLLPEIIKLVPQLAKLTPQITEAAQAFAHLIGWFAENPLRGVVAIMAAGVAKDVAAAGIGSLIAKLLTSQIGSMMALPIAALTIATVGEMFVTEAKKIEQGQNADAKTTTAKLEEANRKAKSDPTPENIEEANRLASEAGSLSEKLNAREDKSHPFRKMVTNTLLGSEDLAANNAREKGNRSAESELANALKELNQTMKSRDVSGDAHGGNAPAPTINSPNREHSQALRGGSSK